ncbi:STAS domain-containing protein [Mycobacterium sp. 236(2023)]|uniref:STAS domain-containing protein n=1 Tax=Mycobacterium sp. 236(2023) TaxID=3038163 RepID=UPI0024152F0E|nr:STAS domain-containing protein [Mycobacterium sp. 236(2023)]MDG4667220.1 STAS domain-containing protein [Mycobacterium sp. 236(2023)]
MAGGGDVSQKVQAGRTQSIAIDVQQLTAGDTVVHLAGDVIGDAATVLRQTLADELSRAPKRLIVNLSEVSRIDARGVDALACAAAIAGEADHDFCLIDGQAGRVHAALAARQLTDLFEIFSSVGEALQTAG